MKATHERKGKTISEIGTGHAETFKSINAAKRESRKLQSSGLGKGQVVVAK